MHERIVTHDISRFISRLGENESPQALITAHSLKEVFESGKFMRSVINGRETSPNDYKALVAAKMVVLDPNSELASIWMLPEEIDLVEIIRDVDPFTVTRDGYQNIDTYDLDPEDIEKAVDSVVSEGLQTIGGAFLIPDRGNLRFDIIFPKLIAQKFGIWKPKQIIAYLLDATPDSLNIESFRDQALGFANPDRLPTYPISG